MEKESAAHGMAAALGSLDLPTAAGGEHGHRLHPTSPGNGTAWAAALVAVGVASSLLACGASRELSKSPAALGW